MKIPDDHDCRMNTHGYCEICERLKKDDDSGWEDEARNKEDFDADKADSELHNHYE